MPVKAAPYAPPAPIFTWTSCYLGGNVGYGWAPTKWSDPATGVEFASHNADGVVGGGQIGCDYQTGPWVFGIQGMFDGAGMTASSHKVTGAGGPPDIFDRTRVSWLATLTGRIGYTIQPVTLLYVKGGAAWIRDKLEECCLPAPAAADDGIANVTRTGWTVGVGLEHMIRPDWSAFVEYNFVGLGTDTITFAPTGFATSPSFYNIRQDVHTMLVGFNYRFVGFR
jgi:outer membrane immunogenic protein